MRCVEVGFVELQSATSDQVLYVRYEDINHVVRRSVDEMADGKLPKVIAYRDLQMWTNVTTKSGCCFHCLDKPDDIIAQIMACANYAAGRPKPRELMKPPVRT